MKRKIGLLTLSVILIFLLFSCEGSITSTFNRFLDPFQDNVFITSGLVKPDTSKVDALVAAISTVTAPTVSDDGTISIGSGDTKVELKGADGEDKKITIGEGDNKLEITIEVGNELYGTINTINTFSPPLSKAELDNINTMLVEISSSPQKKKALTEELNKPASSAAQEQAKGTFKIASAAAEEAIKKVPDDQTELKSLLENVAAMANDVAGSDSIATADVLKSQLLVGMMTDVAALNKTGATDDEKEAATTKIIDQAGTLIQLSKQQVGEFDILKLNGLDSIITDMANTKSVSTRGADETFEVDADVREEIEKYRPALYDFMIKVLGFNGTSFDYDKLEASVNSFKNIEMGYRMMLLTKPDRKFTLDETLNYLTSLVVYQIGSVDKFVTTEERNVATILDKILEDNPWLKKSSDGTFPAIGSEFKLSETVKTAFAIPDDGDASKLSSYVKAGGPIEKYDLEQQVKTFNKVIKNLSSLIPGELDLKKWLDDALNQ